MAKNSGGTKISYSGASSPKQKNEAAVNSLLHKATKYVSMLNGGELKDYGWKELGVIAKEIGIESYKNDKMPASQKEAVDWLTQHGDEVISMVVNKGDFESETRPKGISKYDWERTHRAVSNIDKAFRPAEKDYVVFRGFANDKKGNVEVGVSKSYSFFTPDFRVAADFTESGGNGKVYAFKIPKGTPIIMRRTTGGGEYEPQLILPRNYDYRKFQVK